MKIKASLVWSIVAIIALAVPATVAASRTPAPRQDAPLPELDYTDAQLEILVERVQTYQEEYLTDHNHYYQTLPSHSMAPIGSAHANVNGRPGDQDETLAELWDSAGLPYEINFEFHLNTYNGPQGRGYVVVIRQNIDDVIWQRNINIGPETYREEAWHIVESGN